MEGSYVPPWKQRKHPEPEPVAPAPAVQQESAARAPGGLSTPSTPKTGDGRKSGGDGRNSAGDGGNREYSTIDAWMRFNKNMQTVKEEYAKGMELEVFGEPADKTQHQGGINFDQFFNIPVELTGTGKDMIKEMNNFVCEDYNLHETLVKNIERVGYSKPTPIQRWSVPCIFADKDLMACAQTGSGKTAAFLFPMISRMLERGPGDCPRVGRDYSQYPTALVLSPTRELATQIHKEAVKFTFNTGIRPVLAYGGTPIWEQKSKLIRGCDICIATPGRLSDFLTRRYLSLRICKFLVLDEADRMMDMGFMPQIHEIVNSSDLPPTGDRQTVMFSATFPSAIQNIASDFMKDYLFLTVGRVGSTNECIEQNIIYCKKAQKADRLLQLLSEVEGLTLVFCETKRRCDEISDLLGQHNVGAVSIHGDRRQEEREEALSEFKKGMVSVLVATDVASRGLDISNVTHVINLDMPQNIEDYVHRIGRTGRAGNTGIASTLVNEDNGPVLRDLMRVVDEAKQEVPKWLMDVVRLGSYGKPGGSFTARRKTTYSPGEGGKSFDRGGGTGSFQRGPTGARDVRNRGSAFAKCGGGVRRGGRGANDDDGW